MLYDWNLMANIILSTGNVNLWQNVVLKQYSICTNANNIDKFLFIVHIYYLSQYVQMTLSKLGGLTSILRQSFSLLVL